MPELCSRTPDLSGKKGRVKCTLAARLVPAFLVAYLTFFFFFFNNANEDVTLGVNFWAFDISIPSAPELNSSLPGGLLNKIYWTFAHLHPWRSIFPKNFFMQVPSSLLSRIFYLFEFLKDCVWVFLFKSQRTATEPDICMNILFPHASLLYCMLLPTAPSLHLG